MNTGIVVLSVEFVHSITQQTREGTSMALWHVQITFSCKTTKSYYFSQAQCYPGMGYMETNS